MRDFLWSGTSGSICHLVNWVLVSRPKVKGGLGVERFHLKNKALVRKWLWRLPL